MNIELRIERVPLGVEAQQYAGLLVYGAAAQDWLNCVCRLGISTASLGFLPLVVQSPTSDPKTPSDSVHSRGLPFGALVFGPGLEVFNLSLLQVWNVAIAGRHRAAVEDHADQAEDDTKTNRPNIDSVVYPMQAYYCLAGRLFLPADAQLKPWISESELRLLLPSNPRSVLVWHPIAGLVEYESNQVLRASDLLAAFDVSDRLWNESEIGSVLNSYVASIRPEPESAASLLEIVQGPDGDSTQPLEDILLDPKAPKTAGEVSLPGLRDALGFIGYGVTYVLQAFSNAFGQLKGNSSSRATGEKKEHLSAKRENALKRLLDMLQKDPDQGLKYAIPFGGDNGRGEAPPSAELGERSIDFQLSHLNSGGSIDPWRIPHQYEVRLMRSYRELALRSLRLGQYRRAAYVYAKLLGDLNAAATALESGRHYTDAAAIYKDHLHQPIKAADCLRAAGLWEDCVVIYREQKQWIQAGDVYLQLDDVEQAHEMYRLKIAELESSHNQHSHNCMLAAEIAEKKIKDLDEASRLYIAGWNSPQFTQTNLSRLLEFTARHSRHAQSIGVIEQFAEPIKLSMERTSCALCVLSQASTEYPDSDVRSVARAQSWRLASHVLTSYPPSKSPPSNVFTAIRNLAPEDELLTRDTLRFAVRNQSLPRVTTTPKPKHPRTTGRITLVGTGQVDLPDGMQGMFKWTSSLLTEAALFLKGRHNDEIAIARFVMPAKRALNKGSLPDLVRIVESSGGNTTLIAHPTDQFKAILQRFPGTGEWNDKTAYLGKDPNSILSVLPGHSDVLLCLAFPQSSSVGWALRLDKYGTVRLESIRTDGMVQYFMVIKGLELLEEDCWLVDILHCHDGLIILTNDAIFPIPNPAQARATTGSSSSIDITGLGISLPNFAHIDQTVASPLQLRIAIPLDEGVISIAPQTGDSVRFATELVDPFLCTTASGAYVLCCRRTGKINVFRISVQGPKLIAESDLFTLGISIDDVLSFHNAHYRTQFVIVTKYGKVVQLKVELD